MSGDKEGGPRKNALTIQQGYDAVDTYTGRASEINRSLTLAGIAVIWLFKLGEGADQRVPRELLIPAFSFVLGLAFDLTQYLVSAARWYRLTRRNERAKVTEFVAPAKFNRPGWIFFFAKIGATAVAYVFLLVYLVPRLFR